jgi:hypothetical protein
MVDDKKSHSAGEPNYAVIYERWSYCTKTLAWARRSEEAHKVSRVLSRCPCFAVDGHGSPASHSRFVGLLS